MSDLTRCEGLFEGLLDSDELAEFERWIAAGCAYRSYEGAAGFMGLAKVRLHREVISPDRKLNRKVWE